jgi:hypothetical protein
MLHGDGSFQAPVAIICIGADKTKSQRLDLEVFAMQEAAIERARCAGMDWVDAHAKLDESSFSMSHRLSRIGRKSELNCKHGLARSDPSDLCRCSAIAQALHRSDPGGRATHHSQCIS